jgi:hypothetical protein
MKSTPQSSEPSMAAAFISSSVLGTRLGFNTRRTLSAKNRAINFERSTSEIASKSLAATWLA